MGTFMFPCRFFPGDYFAINLHPGFHSGRLYLSVYYDFIGIVIDRRMFIIINKYMRLMMKRSTSTQLKPRSIKSNRWVFRIV
ncbi:MAG: hypothetical protein CVU71_16375 [Deltaproteobacteria bacterium HGW-Deltaproteobacteria-6]|nr:MAG: hypothetical protein CVU71_16375 [Deltaproteobacteria bacterium HGW-Deltaproteobacteria-6]